MMDEYEVGTLDLRKILDSYRRGTLELEKLLGSYQQGTSEVQGMFARPQGQHDLIESNPNYGQANTYSTMNPQQQQQQYEQQQRNLAARGGGAASPLGPGFGETPAPGGAANTLTQAGTGLLDPGSDYSARIRNEISEDLGARGAAQERAAALRSARSGFGAGASPEMLEMQGDIGRSTMSAIGDATADATLGGIGLGAEMLGAGMQGGIGMRGQDISKDLGLRGITSTEKMQGKSIGADRASQRERLDAHNAQFNAGLEMQGQGMNNQAMLDEMAMAAQYGLPMPGGAYGGGQARPPARSPYSPLSGGMGSMF